MTAASRIAAVARSAIAAWAIAAWGLAQSSVPAEPLDHLLVTLDGTPLGSAIAFRSSAPTIQYDGTTWHMWVQVADETGSGSVAADFYPLRIGSIRHATSTNGTTYTSTGAMSFTGSPFASTVYGSTFGEPPWIYPHVSQWNGHYWLMLWTFNDFFSGTGSPGVFGDYNYNISFNDIGASPGSTAITHRGPVGAVPGNGIYGQTAGPFGIVDGVLYYDNNSTLGRAVLTDNGFPAFPSAYGTGPWAITATSASVADPLTPLGLVACQFSGGTVYVHNAARVIDNGDGTLGWFFTLRNCDGTRYGAQVYYMESSDNGMTWSGPTGIFGGAPTIGGRALVSGFSLADVAVFHGRRVVFFNATDSDGNLVLGALPLADVGATPAVPVPAPGLAVLSLVAALLALSGLARSRAR